MATRLRFTCLFLLCTCWCLQANHVDDQQKAQAIEKLVIGLNHIPGVMDMQDQNAPYNKLLTNILQKIDIPIQTEFYTINRSGFLLENGRLDCMFPVGAGAYPRKVKTTYSKHFNRVTAHLFSFTKPPYSSLKDLRDKTVVYQQGYQFGKLVDTNPFNVAFIPVVNQQAALELIKSAKAQAFMDYLPDIKLTLSPGDFAQLQYDASARIRTFYDVFECLATNAVVISRLNKVIIQMKKSGELKVLLGEHYNL